MSYFILSLCTFDKLRFELAFYSHLTKPRDFIVIYFRFDCGNGIEELKSSEIVVLGRAMSIRFGWNNTGAAFSVGDEDFIFRALV